MQTYTLTTGQVSDVIFVPAGSRVTMSGSGSIQWTHGNKVVAATSPNWQTWSLGSTAGHKDALRDICIKATATGDMTVTVDDGYFDKYPDTAYWEEDIASYFTNSSGAVTGLVGPDGTTIPLLTRKVVTLGLAADTAALATNTLIPFDTVIEDEEGTTTTQFSTDKTHIWIPGSCKAIRVNANIVYKDTGAAPTGTYRGIQFVPTASGATTTMPGVSRLTVPPLRVLYTTPNTNAEIQFASRLINTATLDGWTSATNTNYLGIKARHDDAATTAVIAGSTGYASLFSVEMWF